MLTFFRRLRKGLLDGNRTSKYLLYAIGEIALIVIGILIALQINNWNDWRKDRQEEKEIVQNLHAEFKLNKVLLNTVKINADAVLDANKRLMKLMGKSINVLADINIDSLIYWSWGGDIYGPNQSVLYGLLSSERIEIITNERLKNLLFEWSSAIKINADLFENLNNVAENKYDNYLTEHYSLKDIDMQSELSWENPSELIPDKHKIFHDVKFENMIDNMAFNILEYRMSMNRLEEIIDEILIETGDR